MFVAGLSGGVSRCVVIPFPAMYSRVCVDQKRYRSELRKYPEKTRLSVSDEPRLYPYLKSMSLRQTAVQARLWEAIETHPRGRFSSPPDTAQFLAWLVLTLGAARVLEIGVFLGYTTLSLALAVPDHGCVVALDNEEAFTSVASRFWTEAGVRHRVQLVLGDALESLQRLRADDSSFDLVFIDADKANVLQYYEHALALVRVGGVVVVDNVFWQGKVLDETDQRRSTVCIRQLNQRIRDDARVSISMLPMADGITLCTRLF